LIFVVVSQSKILLVVIYIWRLALASSLCEEHFFLKHARELHIIILRRKRRQAERMSVPSSRLVVAGQARSKQHEQRAASARPLRPGPGGGSSLTQPRGRRQQRRGKTRSAWPRQVAMHCKADNVFFQICMIRGIDL